MTGPHENDEARAAEADAAAKREAKGSVHEAIGTLIGDDAARARGKAEKRAAAATKPDQTSSPS